MYVVASKYAYMYNQTSQDIRQNCCLDQLGASNSDAALWLLAGAPPSLVCSALQIACDWTRALPHCQASPGCDQRHLLVRHSPSRSRRLGLGEASHCPGGSQDLVSHSSWVVGSSVNSGNGLTLLE